VTGTIRLLDLGTVSPLRSQAIYHGLAEALTEDSPDTIALLSPASAYFCAGFHQNPAEELDLAWCRLRRYPVLHRRIGGGTVYLDSDQLFYQCVFHRSRAPFDVASIYGRFLAAPVEALRRLCRLMCGRSVTFRAESFQIFQGLRPDSSGAQPRRVSQSVGKSETCRTSGGKAAILDPLSP